MLEATARSLAAELGFERLVAVSKDEYMDLQVMVLPASLRGRGLGTQFMERLWREADRLGEVIGLCPEPLTPGWTAADKDRLVAWYERFGFVETPDDARYRISYVRMPRS